MMLSLSLSERLQFLFGNCLKRGRSGRRSPAGSRFAEEDFAVAEGEGQRGVGTIPTGVPDIVGAGGTGVSASSRGRA